MNKWFKYFNTFFQEVQRRFHKRYPIQEESAVSPQLIAIRDFIDGLPCSIDLLELRIDTTQYPHIESKICQFIKYDFLQLGDLSVKYLGVVDCTDRHALEKTLAEGFELPKSEAKSFTDSLINRDFRIAGYLDPEMPEIYFQVTHYDIQKNPEKFIKDFLLKVLSPIFLDGIVSKFRKKEIDYNALYDLKKDPVLPLVQLMKKDETFSVFERPENDHVRPITLEDLQEDVCDIQLIPNIPESIQKVFQYAKDLYIFGYFRYHFFTISQHYTFLALESAIKHRYMRSLGNKVVLTNQKNNTVVLSHPTYYEIHDFCHKNKGWNPQKLKVNGEPFRYNMPRLLEWLVDKGVITKWEKDIYDADRQLRNILSHLEQISIFMPSSETLKSVAYHINTLFAENL